MQLYASFKLAPKQIFWTMKYYEFTNPNIDYFIGQAIQGVHPIYSNTKWKFAKGDYNTLFDTSKHEQAEEIRPNLGKNHRIVTGVLGRSEKMQSEKYLASIC